LFVIYKPGQGKYVRWGTVAALTLVIGAGAWWIYVRLMTGWLVTSASVGAAVTAAFVLVTSFLGFLAVNRPKPAEFMIMTESEMRKVTWPTRQTVVNSTKVVIFLTLLLALILFGVDNGFVKLFKWIKIL
jgi:preprotein translocase subunit SecE